VVDFDWGTVRLFLHVLAATIWVGGQIVLAGLLPVLRRLGVDATRQAARQFGYIAWPAFGVLILTGIWNVAAESDQIEGSYGTVLVLKIFLVAVSGLSAFMHARARSRTGLAAWGGLSGTSALVVLLLGVVLGDSSSA
jgi:putative copper export protein